MRLCRTDVQLARVLQVVEYSASDAHGVLIQEHDLDITTYGRAIVSAHDPVSVFKKDFVSEMRAVMDADL